MKRLMFYAIVITLTLALLVLLWQFRSVVILLILSLVLTAALRPSVEFFMDRGLPPGPARILTYVLMLGVIGLALYLIAQPLLNELRVLSNYLVVVYQNLYRAWEAGTSTQQAIAARLPGPDELSDMAGGSAGATALQLLFGVTQNAATVVAGMVIIIVLSLYWSADRSHFERLWLSLLPAGRRIQARRIWQKTEGTMGAYMRSEIIQAFLAVVLLIIGYTLVGNDFPILTGLLAGIAWLIPLVGFVFGALVSFLLGLASTGGLFPAVASLVMTGVVLAFLEFVVEPRLFRRSQFSGVLIIVLIGVMVDAYGLVGFLIAPPLAVALQVSAGQIIQAYRRPQMATVEFDTLSKRLKEIDAMYPPQADGSRGMPPEIASLFDRLTALVDDARRATVDERMPFV